MNLTLYLYLESVCFLLFLISLLYKKDVDIQITFITVSFLTFLGLAIQAFNIEITTLETTWQTYSFTEYYYVLFNFLMAGIAFLWGFLLMLERSKRLITGDVQ